MQCGVNWVLLDMVDIVTVEHHIMWCQLGVVRHSYHSYCGAPHNVVQVGCC